jgi:CRISPR-associated protein (TIGR03984 family)
MSSYLIEPVVIPAEFAHAPAVWLAEQAQMRGLRYLLAHCDDGVVWGRIDDGRLNTSHEIDPAVSPVLRSRTLQQCRLFADTGELLIWRSEEGWCARWLTDTDEGETVDEDQIVWGTEVLAQNSGFSLLNEGRQKMRHLVPLAVSTQEVQERRLRLRVRHYVAYSDAGEARFAASRLVDLLILSK